jgi:UDP-glucose 4-epimerase
MRCVVTGCAGFVGSHLCDQLLIAGNHVVGIDSFTNYYPRVIKQRNLQQAVDHSRFTFCEADLVWMPLHPVLDGADVVFHLAAQSGVRSSWGAEFETYARNNILVTQRLLEACRDHATLRRVVYASSSSIYGNAHALPLTEPTTPHPVSPYGVTKLAAEHLCSLYHANFGVPTVSLRYFTVYGARQRPDMAFHRFIRAACDGEPIIVHEDGNQTRDFTHVGDIVQATIRAAAASTAVGRVYNVAGGSRVTLNHALDTLERVSGRTLEVIHAPKQAGDVRDTYADIIRARRDLAYEPTTDLVAGLRDEVQWYVELPRASHLKPLIGAVR